MLVIVLFKNELKFVWNSFTHVQTKDRTSGNSVAILSEKCFYELAKIALDAYCMPVSTAFVERVFSHMTNVKTKSRNKINTSNLEALLKIRSHLSTNEYCCKDFKVTKNMLWLFNSKMYDGASNDQSSRPSTCSGDSIKFEEIQAIKF